jgi:hypothetical protein
MTEDELPEIPIGPTIYVSACLSARIDTLGALAWLNGEGHLHVDDPQWTLEHLGLTLEPGFYPLRVNRSES